MRQMTIYIKQTALITKIRECKKSGLILLHREPEFIVNQPSLAWTIQIPSIKMCIFKRFNLHEFHL